MQDFYGYLIPECTSCTYWSNDESWDVGCNAISECVFRSNDNKLNLYYYEGPVKYFDTCIDSVWSGTTFAKTEAKAKTNLTYRYKKDHGYLPNTKITLPGEIIMID